MLSGLTVPHCLKLGCEQSWAELRAAAKCSQEPSLLESPLISLCGACSGFLLSHDEEFQAAAVAVEGALAVSVLPAPWTGMAACCDPKVHAGRMLVAACPTLLAVGVACLLPYPTALAACCL